MNEDFRMRLLTVFNHASMAEVARQLKIPHATVRNYFQGRLPATEVLVKIANETGVSLNWLLLGTGDMYAGRRPPIGIGQFLEEKIGEIINKKFAGLGREVVDEIGTINFGAFDLEGALIDSDDPQKVISQWFRHEGRESPSDYGVVFFRGWETFSPADKIAAIQDAKRVLDRTLKG